MGSGKTMLVSEMAQAVLKEDAPVCIEAFDGSTFGPEDADLQVRVCGWNVLWNNLSRREQDSYLIQAAANEREA